MFPSSEQSRILISQETCEYSAAERQLLLRLAHDSIEAWLEDCELDLTPPSPHLTEPRGAFTTLHLGERLRGCIGYVFPNDSLYKTVADTARAAAFDDPRFEPVTRAEAPDLKVEISVLSAAAADQAGRSGGGQARSHRYLWEPSWLTAAPGPDRMEVEPRNFSGPDLPQGWSARRRLAAWSRLAGVHGGSLRGRLTAAEKSKSLLL